MGATLEVIQKRRTEKPEVRDAAREAALRFVFLSIPLTLIHSIMSTFYVNVISALNFMIASTIMIWNR